MTNGNSKNWMKSQCRVGSPRTKNEATNKVVNMDSLETEMRIHW